MRERRIVPISVEVEQFLSDVWNCDVSNVEAFIAATEVRDSQNPEDGFTALMNAILESRLDVVELLLKCSAAINVQAKDGRNALMIACEKKSNINLSIIHLLLNSGADINSVDDNGQSALMISAANGCTAVMLQLLGCDADWELEDNFGRSALDLAMMSGHDDAVQIINDFLSAGALETAVVSEPAYESHDQDEVVALGKVSFSREQNENIPHEDLSLKNDMLSYTSKLKGSESDRDLKPPTKTLSPSSVDAVDNVVHVTLANKDMTCAGGRDLLVEFAECKVNYSAVRKELDACTAELRSLKRIQSLYDESQEALKASREEVLCLVSELDATSQRLIAANSEIQNLRATASVPSPPETDPSNDSEFIECRRRLLLCQRELVLAKSELAAHKTVGQAKPQSRQSLKQAECPLVEAQQEYEEKLLDAAEEMEQFREDVAQFKLWRQQAHGELETLREKVADLTHQLEQSDELRSDLDSCRSERDNLLSIVHSLQSELEQKSAIVREHEAAEVEYMGVSGDEHLRSELMDLYQDLAMSKNQLTVLQSDLTKVTSERDDARATADLRQMEHDWWMHVLEAQFKELVEEKTRTLAETELYNAIVNQKKFESWLAQEREHHHLVNDCNTKIRNLEETISGLLDQAAELDAARTELRQLNEEKAMWSENSREMLRVSQMEVERLKEVLKAAETTVMIQQADLSNLKVQYAAAEQLAADLEKSKTDFRNLQLQYTNDRLKWASHMQAADTENVDSFALKLEQQKLAETTRELKAAQTLVTTLQAERRRWIQTMTELELCRSEVAALKEYQRRTNEESPTCL